MKKTTLITAVFTLLLLFLSACSAEPAPAVEATADPQPAGWIVEGRLMPVHTLDQAFAVPGQVAEVLVEDGDTVTEGQVLARLNGSPEAVSAKARAEQEFLAARQALVDLSAAADTNLAQAKLALITAQTVVDDAQEVYDADESDENKALLEKANADRSTARDALDSLETGGGVDPDEMAAAQARLAAAEAAAAAAQSALDALELQSTTNGTVVDLTLQPGQFVTAGGPVMTIADFSGWVIKTDTLTETEVVVVEMGQEVEITMDALPGTPLRGEVTHINRRFEEKRGDITFTVTASLKETEPRMRWGMTAAVEFLP